MPDTNAIGVDLTAFLNRHAPAELVGTLAAIAEAGIALSHHIRRGGLGAGFTASATSANSDGDIQKALDLYADQLFCEALRSAGARGLISEEREHPVDLNERGAIVVAIDPLDGSSNIDANITMGSIFSLFAAPSDAKRDLRRFLPSGREQLAAGFLLYGPQTCLVLTTGDGVDEATLDPDANCFKMSRLGLRIPENTAEIAINASNYRHWRAPVRAYFDDCIQGAEGPRSKNFNLRWVATMIADVYRILHRGGAYLYPGDDRPGYANGRLHLLYEANPAALLIEQAGGAAIDGVDPILDISPKDIHQRTPLVFGSPDKVARIARYFAHSEHSADRSPLFGKRGLLTR
jgi:fructose-1,6-bisphosphatase I